jgi:hypothetical protein
MEKENHTENGEVGYIEEADEHERCWWFCRGQWWLVGGAVVYICSVVVFVL